MEPIDLYTDIESPMRVTLIRRCSRTVRKILEYDYFLDYIQTKLPHP